MISSVVPPSVELLEPTTP